MCFSDIVYWYIVHDLYITKYGHRYYTSRNVRYSIYGTVVFLKLGESIYVAMDLIPILLGSHNAQHSLVIYIYIYIYPDPCPCTRYL